MTASLPYRSPPQSICLLRLSAIGDICHALPVVRTLQRAWPDTRLTWVIGRTEAGLVGDIPGIEFIIFDKSKRWQAYRDLRGQLKNRRFDALLHMQMSLRASVASLMIRANTRLGFDKARSKDLQWLFTNAHVDPVPRQHVLDSFLEFPRALGIDDPVIEWNIPVCEQDRAIADGLLPNGPYIVISPCSSMAYRNWLPERYAAVAQHAKKHHNLDVVLTGGNSQSEKDMAAAIGQHCQTPLTDLTTRTSLKQLLAVIDKAVCVVAPDSGPAHMATTVHTPVIGLYACTNPDRARPYLSAQTVVSHYAQAVQDKYGKSVQQLPWGIRVRDPGTMARIQTAEVTAMLDKVIQQSG